MRPFASTISLEEARRRLRATVRPITRTEQVALRESSGRVVTADVKSPIDVPPFVRALMDGYAVVGGDTAAATRDAPATLRLVDRIFTGQVSSVAVTSGVCAEIATGAPLPPGADAVVMVEDTTMEGDLIRIGRPVERGSNIGRRGADIAAGDPVVRAGDVLTPGRVGALAAIGCPHVTTYAKPRVAILSTGNEVVEPGRPLSAGEIYDVNRFTLAALVEAHGGIARPFAPARDCVDALAEALDACADSDLVIFSGGSSVGNRDLVTDLIAVRGEMIFHGIAIKPGKPTAFALVKVLKASGPTEVGSNIPFFGMPGNPTSCLMNAYILVVPFLRALARLPDHSPRTIEMPLGRRIAPAAGRHQFYTVRLENNIAVPAFKGSGDITSLSQADGYVDIAADTGADEGDLVTVNLF
jgi:molybdenum cofactor synthesis domain-containing protein